MHHDRTARPTIRVLKELASGWESVHQRRAVESGNWGTLHPLVDLRHPILRKCADELGDDPSRDRAERFVRASGSLRLIEVRSSQWRAGVWTDDEGVRWVVVVGLAKGGHEDHDDFYRTVESVCREESGRQGLLPSPEDMHLLKVETAARIRTRWELGIQSAVLDLLESVVGGGVAECVVRHPILEEDFARIRLTSVLEDDVEEYVVELVDLSGPGSAVARLLESRVLVSVSRPVQGWDISFGIYSAMEEPGHIHRQVETLRTAVVQDELLAPDLGDHAHRVHRRHLGDAAVNGHALRALCGVFFVPTQDAEGLEECPECRRLHQDGSSIPPS